MRAVVLDAFGADLRFADDHPDPDGAGEVIKGRAVLTVAL